MPDSTPHYLIVSYHFRPSNAVGARRPTALKSFLEANGAHVSLIQGIDAALEKPECADGILQIAFSKKRLSRIWLALKARRQEETHAVSVASVGQAAKTERDIAWIRDITRAWNSYLEGDKLWLTRFAWKLRSLPKSTRYSAVIVSGPPQASYVAGMMAARRFDAPLVLDFRDSTLR